MNNNQVGESTILLRPSSHLLILKNNNQNKKYKSNIIKVTIIKSRNCEGNKCIKIDL